MVVKQGGSKGFGCSKGGCSIATSGCNRGGHSRYGLTRLLLLQQLFNVQRLELVGNLLGCAVSLARVECTTPRCNGA